MGATAPGKACQRDAAGAVAVVRIAGPPPAHVSGKLELAHRQQGQIQVGASGAGPGVRWGLHREGTSTAALLSPPSSTKGP